MRKPRFRWSGDVLITAEPLIAAAWLEPRLAWLQGPELQIGVSKTRSRYSPKLCPWLSNYRDYRVLSFSFFLVFFVSQPSWNELQMYPQWRLFSAAKSHSDTEEVCEWTPLPEPSSHMHSSLGGLGAWPGPKCRCPDCQGLWKLSVTLLVIPSLRGAQGEVLPEASPRSDELISVWIRHLEEPTPVPGLACLTNTAVKPRTLKLLPHVKKDLKLQAISTASVRLGKGDQ